MSIFTFTCVTLVYLRTGFWPITTSKEAYWALNKMLENVFIWILKISHLKNECWPEGFKASTSAVLIYVQNHVSMLQCFLFFCFVLFLRGRRRDGCTKKEAKDWEMDWLISKGENMKTSYVDIISAQKTDKNKNISAPSVRSTFYTHNCSTLAYLDSRPLDS